MRKIIASFAIVIIILFTFPLGSIAQNAAAEQQKPNIEAVANKSLKNSDALDELASEDNATQKQKSCC